MSHAEQIDDQQLQAMTRELARLTANQFRQADPTMVMNALLSVYLNVAHSAGRLAEVPVGAASMVSHPAVLAAMGQLPANSPLH